MILPRCGWPGGARAFPGSSRLGPAAARRPGRRGGPRPRSARIGAGSCFPGAPGCRALSAVRARPDRAACCSRSIWSRPPDSNRPPADYRSAALPDELGRHRWSCARRDSNPYALRAPGPRPGASAFPPPARGAPAPVRTGDLLITGEMLFRLSYRGEMPGSFRRSGGRTSAGATRRPAGWAPGPLRYLDSNQDDQGQNLAGCQLPNTSLLPALCSAGLTAVRPGKDSQDGLAAGWARRDSNPHTARFGRASSAGIGLTRPGYFGSAGPVLPHGVQRYCQPI